MFIQLRKLKEGRKWQQNVTDIQKYGIAKIPLHILLYKDTFQERTDRKQDIKGRYTDLQNELDGKFIKLTLYMVIKG